MKVKICGVTRPEDAELACALGAWAVGLIFAPGTPRALELGEARRAREGIRGALAVGVFQDQPREFILAAIESCRLDAIQLHGAEPPAFCSGFPVAVFKALSLDAGVLDLTGYAVDAFLLESKTGAWARARGAAPRFLLAGGLTPENARQAADSALPFALDVGSGVESRPRIKDPVKLRAFFQALA